MSKIDNYLDDNSDSSSILSFSVSGSTTQDYNFSPFSNGPLPDSVKQNKSNNLRQQQKVPNFSNVYMQNSEQLQFKNNELKEEESEESDDDLNYECFTLSVDKTFAEQKEKYLNKQRILCFSENKHSSIILSNLSQEKCDLLSSTKSTNFMNYANLNLEEIFQEMEDDIHSLVNEIPVITPNLEDSLDDNYTNYYEMAVEDSTTSKDKCSLGTNKIIAINYKENDDMLSTGSNENLNEPEKRLRLGMNKITRDKSLIYSNPTIIESEMCSMKRKEDIIREAEHLLHSLRDKALNNEPLVLEIRNLTLWENCNFENDR